MRSHTGTRPRVSRLALHTDGAPWPRRLQRTGMRSNAARVGAALAIALLVGACDDGSSAGTDPTAPDGTLAPSTTLSSGDRAEVEALVTGWDAAWNAGSAAGLGALFFADGEFINGRGQIAQGAAVVVAQHTASLAGNFQGSRTVSRIRAITALSGTAALVDADNDLTGFRALPPGVVPTEPGLNRGRHKRVVVKRDGVWRVLSMQLTTVAPTP